MAEIDQLGWGGDALLTDQYNFPMAQSYWRNGQANDLVTFEMFVRTLPTHRGFLLTAGLDSALSFLQQFHFETEDIDYLRAGNYDEGFLQFLQQLSFSGRVDAVPEGTVIPGQGPILRVTAPRNEAILVESALLSIINHQTMIATKAARINHCAADAPVWDFSLRRLPSPGGAVAVARAAYIAGCAGTATVRAGQVLGIPTAGTMAHHFMQGFGPQNEQQAFVQFLRDNPDNGLLLVDTYDTLKGVANAIEASKEAGVNLRGIRLDSGDLAQLAKQARVLLDQAGMSQSIILASNDLDEYSITELVKAQAPIDAYGVGTKLGACADEPSLGGVYKLVAQQHSNPDYPQLVMKLAPGKETDPGLHQLWRTEQQFYLSMADEVCHGDPLLQTVMIGGQRTDHQETLQTIRERANAQLSGVDERFFQLLNPPRMPLQRSEKLLALRKKLGASQ